MLYTVVMSLLGSAVASGVSPKTEVKAAYVPLASCSHHPCQEDEDLIPPDNIIFHIDRVCQLSDISRLTVSGEFNVVFVLCPDTARRLFRGSGFRVSASVHTEIKALVADPVESEAAPAAPESPVLSRALQNIIKTRAKILERYASDPLIIRVVQNANALPKKQDEITRLDAAWIAGTNADFMEMTLNSHASRFLRKKVKSNKMLYTEAFLCDQQGNTLGAYPRTSDYYQGDETKFTQCYDGGKGKVFTGPLEFDDSTGAYSIQMSVPVRDADRCIGVMVMGLRNIK